MPDCRTFCGKPAKLSTACWWTFCIIFTQTDVFTAKGGNFSLFPHFWPVGILFIHHIASWMYFWSENFCRRRLFRRPFCLRGFLTMIFRRNMFLPGHFYPGEIGAFCRRVFFTSAARRFFTDFYPGFLAAPSWFLIWIFERRSGNLFQGPEEIMRFWKPGFCLPAFWLLIFDHHPLFLTALFLL